MEPPPHAAPSGHASVRRSPPAAVPENPPPGLASWRVLRMWEDGESVAEAATVKLIGVNERHSIVVTAPDAATAPPLAPGRLYRFRSYSGESIYDFCARLLRRCDQPYPYLHLAWPHERQVRERDERAATRVYTQLACTVCAASQPLRRAASGTIVNLSAGGAAIRLGDEGDVPFDEARVLFTLPVAGHDVVVEARARVVRKPDDDGQRVMGVSFSALTQTERLALHAFVQTQRVRELEIPPYAR